MTAFYADPARVELLRSTAEQWRGTRYANRGCAIGAAGGVGCVMYTIALHEATGALQPVDRSLIPQYADDWSSHGMVSQLDQWLEAAGLIAPGLRSTRLCDVITDPEQLLAGDVVAFAPGRVTHHLGTMLSSDRLTHSLKPIGVCEMPLAGLINIGARPRSPLSWFRYALRFQT